MANNDVGVAARAALHSIELRIKITDVVTTVAVRELHRRYVAFSHETFDGPPAVESGLCLRQHPLGNDG